MEALEELSLNEKTAFSSESRREGGQRFIFLL